MEGKKHKPFIDERSRCEAEHDVAALERHVMLVNIHTSGGFSRQW